MALHHQRDPQHGLQRVHRLRGRVAPALDAEAYETTPVQVGQQSTVQLLLQTQDDGNRKTAGQGPVGERVAESDERRTLRGRRVQIEHIHGPSRGCQAFIDGVKELGLLARLGARCSPKKPLRRRFSLRERSSPRLRRLRSLQRADTLRLPDPVEIFVEESTTGRQRREIASQRDEVSDKGDRTCLERGNHSLKRMDARGLVPMQAGHAQ